MRGCAIAFSLTWGRIGRLGDALSLWFVLDLLARGVRQQIVRPTKWAFLGRDRSSGRWLRRGPSTRGRARADDPRRGEPPGGPGPSQVNTKRAKPGQSGRNRDKAGESGPS